jgi:putative transcriptional regulator
MSKITIRAMVGQTMADQMVVDEDVANETVSDGTTDHIGPSALEDTLAQHEDMDRIRPGPRVKTVRRALGLTQEEFAARYGIPLGTLRDWEQGRTEPDQPARAYIKVIASNPEWVSRALAAEPQ